jgi:hypothetical protein
MRRTIEDSVNRGRLTALNKPFGEMALKRTTLLPVLFIAFGASCAVASDSNPLGFYVGGAVGQSDVRDSNIVYGLPI